MDRTHACHPLRLRMVLSQGQTASIVVPLQTGQTLAQILALSPIPVPQDQQIAAMRCRIDRDGELPNGDALWWLTNDSAELMCSVNGESIAQGERVRLNEGDALEAALMRCIVVSAEPVPDRYAVGPGDSPVSGQADPYPDFVLTDLLVDHAETSLDSEDSQHAAPLHDIADVVLLDLNPPAATPQEDDSLDDSVIPDPAPEVPPPIMRDLHAEYLRLMRNPHELSLVQDWSLYAQPPEIRHELDELINDEAQRDDLYDLLGLSDMIEPVLAELDTLSEQGILEPEAHVDVLRLFAPEDLREQSNALPELTRREHHVLSADSATLPKRSTLTATDPDHATHSTSSNESFPIP